MSTDHLWGGAQGRPLTRRTFLSIAATAAAGCSGEPLAGAPTAARSVEHVQYAETSGVRADRQTLDVYPAESGAGNPVVVYVHGGGWVTGDKSEVGAKPDWIRTEHGGVFVSTNYRLSARDGSGPTHPVHVRDVARAVAWTLDNATTYGGDPRQVFLLGHSAGAHLVALVAVAREYLADQGHDPGTLAGVFPVDSVMYDLPWLYEREPELRRSIDAAIGTSRRAHRDASPVHRVDGADGDLPAFVFAYTDGVGRRSTARLVERLTGVGVESRVVDRTGIPASPPQRHLLVDRELGTPGDPLTAVLDAAIRDV